MNGIEGSLRGFREIATLARGRVAEQHGAEAGQVADLDEVPNRALAAAWPDLDLTPAARHLPRLGRGSRQVARGTDREVGAGITCGKPTQYTPVYLPERSRKKLKFQLPPLRRSSRGTAVIDAE
jgi:hypothetical protein